MIVEVNKIKVEIARRFLRRLWHLRKPLQQAVRHVRAPLVQRLEPARQFRALVQHRLHFRLQPPKLENVVCNRLAALWPAAGLNLLVLFLQTLNRLRLDDFIFELPGKRRLDGFLGQRERASEIDANLTVQAIGTYEKRGFSRFSGRY